MYKNNIFVSLWRFEADLDMHISVFNHPFYLCFRSVNTLFSIKQDLDRVANESRKNREI